MKRLLLVISLAVVAVLPAQAAPNPSVELAHLVEGAGLTNETLVDVTPTLLPQLSTRNSIEIVNYGPNPIWCALTDPTKAVIGSSHKVDANGGSWALDLSPLIPIYCITSVKQVSGAATVTTELPQ